MVTSDGCLHPERPQCSDPGIARALETTATCALVWPTWGSTSCPQGREAVGPHPRAPAAPTSKLGVSQARLILERSHRGVANRFSPAGSARARRPAGCFI